MIHGQYTNPCPALTWNETRYVCALYLRDPARYERFLEMGVGCCSPLNSRRQDLPMDGQRPMGGAR
jgi:hypothetical protein